PLLFESGEMLAVSNEILEAPFRVYPEDVPWREPRRDREAAFVVETDAPIRSLVETRCEQVFGLPPSAREYGKLTGIPNRYPSQLHFTLASLALPPNHVISPVTALTVSHGCVSL